MDKIRLAAHTRQHLERRIAFLLDCKPEELPKMKLGTMVHLIFLFVGAEESVGGFNTSMRGLLELIGHELVWKAPEDTSVSEAEEKVVIN